MTTTTTTNTARCLYVVSRNLEGSDSNFNDEIGVSISLGDAQAFVIREIAKERKAYIKGTVHITTYVAIDESAAQDVSHYAILDKYSGAVKYHAPSAEREEVEVLAKIFTRKRQRVYIEAYATQGIRSWRF